YGHGRDTSPRLEALAREGVRFDHAIAPAPWTLPSHASMFTGRHPHELSADWRTPLDDEHPTIAEFLRERGYATAGFVANMGYCGWESGIDRGFLHYEDVPVSPAQVAVSSAMARALINHPAVRRLVGSDENVVRKSAAEVNAAFLAWLDRRAPADHPYFAFLNYYDAHAPYMPPEPYRTAFASGEPRGGVSPLHRWNANPFGTPPGPEEIRAEREAYEATIAYVDAQIGRLVDELEARGRLDRTVLVVTSDHGEEFGEHGVYDHGNSLYLESLHVPLVIRYPARLPAGRRVAGPIPLRRLAATLADLAGFDAADRLPGKSLASAWDGPPEAAPVLSEVSHAPGLPDWFPVSRGDMRSVIHGDWHYILRGDGVEELFDTAVDPGERANLAGVPAAMEPLARARAALRA
ncbi:MAG: sulfatase family protein, partial [Gemmatimonadota bacterium]